MCSGWARDRIQVIGGLYYVNNTIFNNTIGYCLVKVLLFNLIYTHAAWL